MTEKQKKKMDPKAPPRGQEINVNFKHERGENPDSEENLEQDLIDPKEYQNHSPDAKSFPKEWQAREDQNRDQ